MIPTLLLLTFVTAERLGELWLARRNTAALLARGAFEVAPGHYPLIVVLHAAWVIGLWALGWDRPLEPISLTLFLLLQAARVWTLGTLGPRWTTRIIVLPGAPLVTGGPYRFVSHPNYLIVVGEIALLPLCLGLPWYALAFSLANAAVLAIRIRAENASLAETPAGPRVSDAPPPRPAWLWIGFTAMCMGMFMAILDVQIVATSLPAIQGALGMAPEQMSWIQTAYLIAEVVAIPLTGLLTRLLTMRWLFVGAVSAFTLASIGCAASTGFAALVAWRIVQGFAGGTLIPAVFSAVFLLFPLRRQSLATMLAGVLAVLAPTVGPVVGGWITETFSWNWLFLINVAPGLAAAALAVALLPRERPDWEEARTLDLPALGLMATALTALELALKEAPQRGWMSGLALALLVLSAASGAGFVARTLVARHRLVELRTFADRNFAIGCGLSFVLGIGLFGSVYLMPVFLAFVRLHDALEIGAIMLVTGVAQLLSAPLAVALERKVDARPLAATGFGVFALGLGLSALQTPQTDYDGMFWPQVLRGVAIMFCLLPPTRLALGGLDPLRVPDASGMFNLMRNLGGAIGIALIDSVIYGRAPILGERLAQRLKAGDPEAARFLGLSPDTFAARLRLPVDDATREALRPLIEHAATTQAINEAWALIALLTLAAMLCVPFARRASVPASLRPSGH